MNRDFKKALKRYGINPEEVRGLFNLPVGGSERETARIQYKFGQSLDWLTPDHLGDKYDQIMDTFHQAAEKKLDRAVKRGIIPEALARNYRWDDPTVEQIQSTHQFINKLNDNPAYQQSFTKRINTQLSALDTLFQNIIKPMADKGSLEYVADNQGSYDVKFYGHTPYINVGNWSKNNLKEGEYNWLQPVRANMVGSNAIPFIGDFPIYRQLKIGQKGLGLNLSVDDWKTSMTDAFNKYFTSNKAPLDLLRNERRKDSGAEAGDKVAPGASMSSTALAYVAGTVRLPDFARFDPNISSGMVLNEENSAPYKQWFNQGVTHVVGREDLAEAGFHMRQAGQTAHDSNYPALGRYAYNGQIFGGLKEANKEIKKSRIEQRATNNLMRKNADGQWVPMAYEEEGNFEREALGAKVRIGIGLSGLLIPEGQGYIDPNIKAYSDVTYRIPFKSLTDDERNNLNSLLNKPLKQDSFTIGGAKIGLKNNFNEFTLTHFREEDERYDPVHGMQKTLVLTGVGAGNPFAVDSNGLKTFAAPSKLANQYGVDVLLGSPTDWGQLMHTVLHSMDRGKFNALAEKVLPGIGGTDEYRNSLRNRIINSDKAEFDRDTLGVYQKMFALHLRDNTTFEKFDRVISDYSLKMLQDSDNKIAEMMGFEKLPNIIDTVTKLDNGLNRVTGREMIARVDTRVRSTMLTSGRGTVFNTEARTGLAMAYPEVSDLIDLMGKPARNRHQELITTAGLNQQANVAPSDAYLDLNTESLSPDVATQLLEGGSRGILKRLAGVVNPNQLIRLSDKDKSFYMPSLDWLARKESVNTMGKQTSKLYETAEQTVFDLIAATGQSDYQFSRRSRIGVALDEELQSVSGKKGFIDGKDKASRNFPVFGDLMLNPNQAVTHMSVMVQMLRTSAKEAGVDLSKEQALEHIRGYEQRGESAFASPLMRSPLVQTERMVMADVYSHEWYENRYKQSGRAQDAIKVVPGVIVISQEAQMHFGGDFDKDRDSLGRPMVRYQNGNIVRAVNATPNEVIYNSAMDPNHPAGEGVKWFETTSFNLKDGQGMPVEESSNADAFRNSAIEAKMAKFQVDGQPRVRSVEEFSSEGTKVWTQSKAAMGLTYYAMRGMRAWMKFISDDALGKETFGTSAASIENVKKVYSAFETFAARAYQNVLDSEPQDEGMKALLNFGRDGKYRIDELFNVLQGAGKSKKGYAYSSEIVASLITPLDEHFDKNHQHVANVIEAIRNGEWEFNDPQLLQTLGDALGIQNATPQKIMESRNVLGYTRVVNEYNQFVKTRRENNETLPNKFAQIGAYVKEVQALTSSKTSMRLEDFTDALQQMDTFLPEAIGGNIIFQNTKQGLGGQEVLTQPWQRLERARQERRISLGLPRPQSTRKPDITVTQLTPVEIAHEAAVEQAVLAQPPMQPPPGEPPVALAQPPEPENIRRFRANEAIYAQEQRQSAVARKHLAMSMTNPKDAFSYLTGLGDLAMTKEQQIGRSFQQILFGKRIYSDQAAERRIQPFYDKLFKNLGIPDIYTDQDKRGLEYPEEGMLLSGRAELASENTVADIRMIDPQGRSDPEDLFNLNTEDIRNYDAMKMMNYMKGMGKDSADFIYFNRNQVIKNVMKVFGKSQSEAEAFISDPDAFRTNLEDYWHKTGRKEEKGVFQARIMGDVLQDAYLGTYNFDPSKSYSGFESAWEFRDAQLKQTKLVTEAIQKAQADLEASGNPLFTGKAKQPGQITLAYTSGETSVSAAAAVLRHIGENASDEVIEALGMTREQAKQGITNETVDALFVAVKKKENVLAARSKETIAQSLGLTSEYHYNVTQHEAGHVLGYTAMGATVVGFHVGNTNGMVVAANAKQSTLGYVSGVAGEMATQGEDFERSPAHLDDIYNYAKIKFGVEKLTDIKPEHVEAFYTEAAEFAEKINENPSLMSHLVNRMQTIRTWAVSTQVQDRMNLAPGTKVTLSTISPIQDLLNIWLNNESIVSNVQAAAITATDSAQKLADENGIDLSTVQGTGKNGQITKKDAQKAVSQARRAARTTPPPAAPIDNLIDSGSSLPPEPPVPPRSNDRGMSAANPMFVQTINHFTGSDNRRTEQAKGKLNWLMGVTGGDVSGYLDKLDLANLSKDDTRFLKETTQMLSVLRNAEPKARDTVEALGQLPIDSLSSQERTSLAAAKATLKSVEGLLGTRTEHEDGRVTYQNTALGEAATKLLNPKYDRDTLAPNEFQQAIGFSEMQQKFAPKTKGDPMAITNDRAGLADLKGQMNAVPEVAGHIENLVKQLGGLDEISRKAADGTLKLTDAHVRATEVAAKSYNEITSTLSKLEAVRGQNPIADAILSSPQVSSMWENGKVTGSLAQMGSMLFGRGGGLAGAATAQELRSILPEDPKQFSFAEKLSLLGGRSDAAVRRREEAVGNGAYGTGLERLGWTGAALGGALISSVVQGHYAYKNIARTFVDPALNAGQEFHQQRLDLLNSSMANAGMDRSALMGSDYFNQLSASSRAKASYQYNLGAQADRGWSDIISGGMQFGGGIAASAMANVMPAVGLGLAASYMTGAIAPAAGGLLGMSAAGIAATAPLIGTAVAGTALLANGLNNMTSFGSNIDAQTALMRNMRKTGGGVASDILGAADLGWDAIFHGGKSPIYEGMLADETATSIMNTTPDWFNDYYKGNVRRFAGAISGTTARVQSRLAKSSNIDEKMLDAYRPQIQENTAYAFGLLRRVENPTMSVTDLAESLTSANMLGVQSNDMSAMAMGLTQSRQAGAISPYGNQSYIENLQKARDILVNNPQQAGLINAASQMGMQAQQSLLGQGYSDFSFDALKMSGALTTGAGMANVMRDVNRMAGAPMREASGMAYALTPINRSYDGSGVKGGNYFDQVLAGSHSPLEYNLLQGQEGAFQGITNYFSSFDNSMAGYLPTQKRWTNELLAKDMYVSAQSKMKAFGQLQSLGISDPTLTRTLARQSEQGFDTLGTAQGYAQAMDISPYSKDFQGVLSGLAAENDISTIGIPDSQKEQYLADRRRSIAQYQFDDQLFYGTNVNRQGTGLSNLTRGITGYTSRQAGAIQSMDQLQVGLAMQIGSGRASNPIFGAIQSNIEQKNYAQANYLMQGAEWAGSTVSQAGYYQSNALSNAAFAVAQFSPEMRSTVQQAAGGSAAYQSLLALQGNAPAWQQTMQVSLTKGSVISSGGGTVGMSVGYDDTITSEQAARFKAAGVSRGFIRGDGRYSVDQLTNMNQVQRENAVQALSIESREFGFGMERKQFAREASMSTYGIGLGKMLGNAAFEGKGQYYFEDWQRNLGRRQEDYSMQQQGLSLNLQERGLGNQFRQFFEKFDLNQRQFAENTTYQRREMDIGHGHQRQSFQWQMQDMSYQRNMSELSFGFSMIDAEENIRYSTGRERRVAMRHRDQAVISHTMEMGQMDKEKDRAKERQKWEEEQFAREKDHFEKGVEFQKEEMELSKKHFLEDMALSRDRFELEKKQYAQRFLFIAEERRLEDEQRLVQRAAHAVEIAEKQQIMNFNQMIKRTMDDLSGAGTIADTELRKAQASLNYLVQTSQYLTNLNPNFVTLNNTLMNIPNIINSIGSAISTVFSGLQSYGDSLASHYHHNPGGFGGHDIDGEGYAAGGFTGYGGKHQKAGIVHKGEFVVPQEGSPVLMAPKLQETMERVHDTLLRIEENGGNAIINVHTNSATGMVKEGYNIYRKALGR